VIHGIKSKQPKQIQSKKKNSFDVLAFF